MNFYDRNKNYCNFHCIPCNIVLPFIYFFLFSGPPRLAIAILQASLL